MTHANRGNVAVICWNTLRTPTWYVNDEKLDGEISLSARDQKTLLEINFEEYTHENSKEVGALKEVEAKVVNTPARTTEIGDRQIVLDFNITENGKYDFDFKSKSDYKKSVQETKTYLNGAKDVVAYVPEEVYSDIDSLRNKTVTVIFGEDNVVALIVVEDDAVEKEFLTKYVKADSEITVGGEKYDLADEYEVVVNDTEIEERDAEYALTEDTTINAQKTYYTKNGKEYTEVSSPVVGDIATYYEKTVEEIEFNDPLEYALKLILGTNLPKKAFDKKVEAELILNEDEEVTRIELFVSGTYNAFNTVETVAKKVKSEKITTVAGDITWNEKKYDDKDYPRVYIDGKKAEITDIEAGDVLTIFGTVGDAKKITVIYASRETVEGEITKVKNKTEIYVDGTSYLPSAITKALELKDEIKDIAASDTCDDFKSIHGEDAVLYLNVLGEYVLVSAESVDSDWQFAVVDHIYDVEENEEDSDLYSQKLRVVMMDGTKARNYKLVYDANNDYTDDDKVILKFTENNGTKVKYGYKGDTITDYTETTYEGPDGAVNGLALTGKVDVDSLVAFKANADGEIELDDIFAVNTKAVGNSDIDDYKFVKLSTTDQDTTVKYDNKRIDTKIGTTNTRFKVTSNTKLFDMKEKEAISWKDLVDENPDKLSVDTLLVYKDNETEVSYLIALDTASATSDTEYALVLDATYTTSKTKTEAKLLGVDGKEYIYEYDDDDVKDGALIAYTVSNNKLSLVSGFTPIDLEVACDAEDEDNLVNSIKGAYKVKKVENDYIEYTDDEDLSKTLDPRFVDINTDDVIVVRYDYDSETLVSAEFNAETLEDEYVLFFNTDSDPDDYELLVIIK